ncbi:MAG TPA: hypothetical protein VHJ38_19225, partial [Nitrososphaeraceae archaeon]|nr:hypothetical protein [Nitrososphaeraceae archaeon]
TFMERVNQYFKDRTEFFDDYYPCIQKEESNFYMYIIGYNSLYLCIMIQRWRIIYYSVTRRVPEFNLLTQPYDDHNKLERTSHS